MVAAALVLALLTLPIARAIEPLTYRNAAEETRFRVLTSSLRCVMCQNESLADSSAPIAHDLRREILDLMDAGQSDAQIRDYLVARYGEFVLYAPRVEPSTWVLWFGPIALLLAGGVVLIVVVRHRAARTARDAAPDATPERSEDW
ncbi:MAG: cytochrome c-type biogenesis protein [Lysobacteraceae bacterium]